MYNSEGSRVAECVVPDATSLLPPAWSPSGDAVAISCSDRSVWVWTLRQSCQQVSSTTKIDAIAWASCSTTLLLISRRLSRLRAHLWTAGTQELSAPLAEVTHSRECAISWVHHVVLLCEPASRGYRRMQVYEQDQGALTLLYALTARDGSAFFGWLNMQLVLCSPDGSYCLFVVTGSEASNAEYELFVINLRTMAQRSLQMLDFAPVCLAWAPDSSAVYVDVWCYGGLLLNLV